MTLQDGSDHSDMLSLVGKSQCLHSLPSSPVHQPPTPDQHAPPPAVLAAAQPEPSQPEEVLVEAVDEDEDRHLPPNHPSQQHGYTDQQLEAFLNTTFGPAVQRWNPQVILAAFSQMHG